MEEKRKSAGSIDIEPLQEAVLTPIKKYGEIESQEKYANKQTIVNEKELEDILDDKELKENLIQMILQNEWPFSDISDGEKFAKLLVIIQRDIDSDLSNELSKTDITEGESDNSDLLHKKIANYMLKMVEKLYENQLDDYSLMNSTPKFEYELIIERNKDDTNSLSRNPNTTVMLVGSDKVIRNSVSLSDDSHTKISFPIMGNPQITLTMILEFSIMVKNASLNNVFFNLVLFQNCTRISKFPNIMQFEGKINDLSPK